MSVAAAAAAQVAAAAAAYVPCVLSCIIILETYAAVQCFCIVEIVLLVLPSRADVRPAVCQCSRQADTGPVLSSLQRCRAAFEISVCQNVFYVAGCGPSLRCANVTFSARETMFAASLYCLACCSTGRDAYVLKSQYV